MTDTAGRAAAAPSADGPLAAEIIAALDDRLGRLDPRMSAAQAAARLYHLADILNGGPPPDDLFIHAAAVALWGAFRARLAAAPGQPGRGHARLCAAADGTGRRRRGVTAMAEERESL